MISAPEQCHKALGVHWDTAQDSLHVATPTLDPTDSPTKRQVASDVARTFNILGWFAPAVILIKILLQHLWQLQLGWDKMVPDDITQEWQSWRREITEHPVSRCKDKERISIAIHRFSDAFQHAYVGVIYIRTVYRDATASVSLVIAKTKVAPLMPSTIPRLELCGALLLNKLLQTVREDLSIQTDSVYAWMDSSIVLSWINSAPGKLKAFAANRVADITDRIPSTRWRYVSTLDNQADMASRGMSPKELRNFVLWWQGPPCLPLPPEDWPIRTDLTALLFLQEPPESPILV